MCICRVKYIYRKNMSLYERRAENTVERDLEREKNANAERNDMCNQQAMRKWQRQQKRKYI